MMMIPALADLRGKQLTEPVPPVAHGLVADVDATLDQQVLDLPQRQREANIHHHSEPDHFGQAVEITEGVLHA